MLCAPKWYEMGFRHDGSGSIKYEPKTLREISINAIVITSMIIATTGFPRVREEKVSLFLIIYKYIHIGKY